MEKGFWVFLGILDGLDRCDQIENGYGQPRGQKLVDSSRGNSEREALFVMIAWMRRIGFMDFSKNQSLLPTL